MAGGTPTLDGNTITGNAEGLRIGRATPVLTGNTVCDNGTNLVRMPGNVDPGGGPMSSGASSLGVPGEPWPKRRPGLAGQHRGPTASGTATSPTPYHPSGQ